MIGVLTDITFECELSFNLRESITIHSLDHCLQNMGSLSVQSEHGKLWLEAHSGMCAVFDVRRTQDHVTQDQGVDLWDVKVYMILRSEANVLYTLHITKIIIL